MKRKRKLTRYPWDNWFKKAKLVLVRHKDYECQPHSMSVQVRDAAAKRGFQASVEIDEGTITATIYR